MQYTSCPDSALVGMKAMPTLVCNLFSFHAASDHINIIDCISFKTKTDVLRHYILGILHIIIRLTHVNV